MISYCNANDAARMAKEYWNEKERKAKEAADKLFPEVMICVNDEIISAASIGQGKCTIDIFRLSNCSDIRCRRYLREKVEKELTETLGYRIVACCDIIDIVWCTDV